MRRRRRGSGRFLHHRRRRGRFVTSPALRTAPLGELATFFVDRAREAPAVPGTDQRVVRFRGRRQGSAIYAAVSALVRCVWHRFNPVPSAVPRSAPTTFSTVSF